MRQERAVEIDSFGFVRQSLLFSLACPRLVPDCERANFIPDRFCGSIAGIFTQPLSPCSVNALKVSLESVSEARLQ
jgi:hypothetical protein